MKDVSVVTHQRLMQAGTVVYVIQLAPMSTTLWRSMPDQKMITMPPTSFMKFECRLGAYAKWHQAGIIITLTELNISVGNLLLATTYSR